MTHPTSRLRILTFLSLWLLVACQPEASQRALEGIDTYFPVQLGTESIQVQVALSPQEQAKGLMYRESLAPNHGMLFVFPTPGQRSFWMRNTQLPLDIGYIDASGKLLEIHALYPYDETPVPSHSDEILMCLEMTQGWFRRAEIQPGAQLDVEAVQSAIEARGYSVKMIAFEAAP